jgi:hypothetical protein
MIDSNDYKFDCRQTTNRSVVLPKVNYNKELNNKTVGREDLKNRHKIPFEFWRKIWCQ